MTSRYRPSPSRYRADDRTIAAAARNAGFTVVTDSLSAVMNRTGVPTITMTFTLRGLMTSASDTTGAKITRADIDAMCAEAAAA